MLEYDDYQADAEEDAYWTARATEEIESWIQEHYPFVRGSRRRELIECGLDVVDGVDGAMTWESDDGESGYLCLNKDAERQLRRASACALREMRTRHVEARPVLVHARACVRRVATRPRERRGSRRRVATRAGPDDTSDGEHEPAGHRRLAGGIHFPHRAGDDRGATCLPVTLAPDQPELDLIADRLAAREVRTHEAGGLTDAAELARRLGRSREFVYDSAAALGAVRIGDGKRPRLAFRWPLALDALRLDTDTYYEQLGQEHGERAQFLALPRSQS